MTQSKQDQSENELINKYRRLRAWGFKGTKPVFKLPKYTNQEFAQLKAHPRSEAIDAKGNWNVPFLNSDYWEYDLGRFYHLRNKI